MQKGRKLPKSIIKWKNQYELKQREVETMKRNKEIIMKITEEIIRQFDQSKEQHQKNKQKEQQKDNEITKISQEKKILEALVKTFENYNRIKLNHVSDKDQQHYVKSIQIRSFPWSVSSRIQSKYGKIQTRKNFVFEHFLRSANQRFKNATTKKRKNRKRSETTNTNPGKLKCEDSSSNRR